MPLLPAVLAFVAGSGLVVQVAMNMALTRAFGNGALAVLVNFLVGTLALVALLLATRTMLPSREQLVSVPAWAWAGGLLGALYVSVANFAGPRLGALLLLALAVSGQMFAAILVDHYGLLGYAVQPASTQRLLGAALLLGGLLLIAR
ncbi:MAG: DMT family transporter [Steroidobacteraceae bacterium]|jgi:transporter family-2 protein|nr:DMT family transporter [Gammaproteobacteria bacterium]